MKARAETPDVPYVRYLQHKMLKQTTRVNVYLHRASNDEQLVVKLWLGMRRGESVAIDLALTSLVEGAKRLIVSPVESLPQVVDVGLSPVGPFVVYRYVDGTTLDQVGPLNAASAVDIAEKLIHATDALHAMDLHHGDISDKNVLLAADGSAVSLLDLFDLSKVGVGLVRTTKYCPEGWEKLTEQQIDRYAALKLSTELLTNANDERLATALSVLSDELQRQAIETFEPGIIALKEAGALLREPPPPRFVLRSPDLVNEALKSDDGHYFVRVQRISRDCVQYSIAGVDRELRFELYVGREPAHWFTNVSYGSLMHASMHGLTVRCFVELENGSNSGFGELLTFLQEVVSPPAVDEQAIADQMTPSATGRAGLDVPRYWRRLIDLEETFQPEIEILRDLGSRGGFAAYAYERRVGDFDFDAESTVDVRLYGRKVGEVDLTQTDERTIVIRYSDRTLTTGDRVTLIDRRSRASFDRRRKAVKKILDDEAALSGLIQYFSSGTEVESVDHTTAIEESVLDAYGLNAGQKQAFRFIVRYGPVGLLQGPPGTGKTLFIAALVHWLVTQAGAQRILIASQSNEAVNNAIEKLVDLFKGLKRRPSLLRIGSKGITQKIRPYHTSSSRDRYRVRFDTAFKHRVVALGAAIGLKREFVAKAVEIDRLLGRPLRRIHTLTEAAKNAEDLTPEDRRRYETSLRAATNAFLSAGKQLLGREVNAGQADDELDDAYEQLLASYPGMSPGDVIKVRGLITLSLEWSDALASSHRNFEEFLAKTRVIIAATCVGAGQTRIRIDAKIYDWVIVDEAARCTPGELAVPIQVGRRVLLVGDHLQLRPMIEREVLNRLAEDMPGISRAELSRSDFERSYASNFGRANGQVLTEQYRMAPAICDLISEVFYEPHQVRLKTSDDRKGDPVFSGTLPKPLTHRLTWIDTSAERNHLEKRPEWNRHSFWNPAEVAATISILERISENEPLVSALAAGVSETPIGIICMYSGQKVKIEQAFTQRPWEARFRRLVRIDTVDSYQGKENAIVITSLVRCNPHHGSGHVGSFNRCNVALSRAKEHLFIVGAKNMWLNTAPDHPMRKVLEFIMSHRANANVLRAGEV